MTSPADDPSPAAAEQPPDPREGVVAEQVIMLDRNGNTTDDPRQAVRGGIITTYDDGTVLTTSFTA